MLGIPARETTLARRGFGPAEPVAQARLEEIGAVFLDGYHAALEVKSLDELAEALEGVGAERRGWAYEGAAMGLTLVERLGPWRRDRVLSFLEGPGAAHAYMVHIGVGWALARLRQRGAGLLARMDPLLHWLVVDGVGFHEGYFHPRRCFERQRRPGRIRGYAERVFDQGLGRCLWFVAGADVERIGRMIAAFPDLRRQDLWSGIGLACAYAGGVDQEAVEELRFASGRCLAHAAQGAAFAAKARERAGNPADHTDMAVRVLCGTSARQAAEITDEALGELSSRAGERGYELWRQKIRTLLAIEEEVSA